MVNIADSYFEAIEHANGKLAPFADDCVRRENGGQTTHNAKPVPWPVPLGSKQADDAMAYIGTLSCSDQLDTHVMDFITRLWPRRHEVVDEELGNRVLVPDVQSPRRIRHGQDLQRARAWRACRWADLHPACRRESYSRSTMAALSRSKRWARRCHTARRAVGASSRDPGDYPTSMESMLRTCRQRPVPGNEVCVSVPDAVDHYAERPFA